MEIEREVARERFRSRVLRLAVVSIAFDLVAAALAWWFEQGAPHEFGTYWAALFWTTTQLLTVSSQIQNPFTTGGRIVDVFLELYAITVVTTLAGSWGAFFHQRSKERKAQMRQPAPGER